MALTKRQKVGILQGLSDLAKAFVDGADEAKRRKDSEVRISGPAVPTPKPGCSVCGGKK